jgi:hypothetical protein
MAVEHPFSIHPIIRNKPPTWEPAFADDWAERKGSLETLKGFISQGYAFIPAAMTSAHRSTAAFGYADLVVVDIDHGLTIEQFRSHPLASSAAWVYTTCSHRPGEQERFRVIFRLPWRIDDPDLYKATVTLLSRSLGGDRSCTDPCRLFYGNDQAEHPIWNPDAVLPESIIDDARTEAGRTRVQYDRATAHYDDNTIRQAVFVLEQVLEPTSDGERDRFIRTTAAAASAGEPLFQAWSDWASRGHHGSGKNSRQANEKFFRGFHGRSTLATLFFLASEQNPDWRKALPEELRSSFSFTHATANVAGYDHEDFLGLIDEENERPRQITTAELATPSLFDTERPWMTVLQPPEQPAVKPAGIAAGSGADGPPAFHDEDFDDSDEEIDPELLEDPYADILGDFTPPEQPRAGIPRRRGQRGGEDDVIETIKSRLQAMYPGLRQNALSLQLEYGPADAPKVIHDSSTSYVRISRGTDKVFPKTLVYDVAQVIGYENRYHPVRAYLEHCIANAEPCPYFESIATEILGLSGDPLMNPDLDEGRKLADVIIERFLIGAVARVMQPGCDHDWMPILIGSQNSGKSNFFRYLTPPDNNDSNNYPWVSTIQQGIQTLKDRPHQLHAAWFVVLDEVERFFKRRYTEELKNMVSISVDRSARKYENERDFPRGFVLCGATNSTDFLVDPTGNRRFMPVVVAGKIRNPLNRSVKIVDLDRLKRDREAIWAAACRAYMDNKAHTWASHELAMINGYQNSFISDSAIEAKVASVLETRCSGIWQKINYVTLADIFEWLDIPVDRQPTISLAITDALKRLGWQVKRAKIAGQVRRIWIRNALLED